MHCRNLVAPNNINHKSRPIHTPPNPFPLLPTLTAMEAASFCAAVAAAAPLALPPCRPWLLDGELSVLDETAAEEGAVAL